MYQENVRNYLKSLPLVVPPSKFYNKKYSPVMEFTGSVLIDRTNTYKDIGYDNIVIEDSIPQHVINPGDFSFIVDKTTKNIIELSKTKNKQIAILYSGGLDSTCVTSSFIKNGATVNLVYSNASIEENVVFFNDVLKNNKQVIHHIGNPLMFLSNKSDEYIFVTGECGAHLMGTINWSKYGGREIEDKDIIGADETAASIFKNTTPYFNIPSDARENLMRIYEKSPVPLKTNYDAQWWAIFVLKWQFVKYRMQLWAGVISDDLINFFMTDDFQMWALYNDVTVKCPNYEWKKYKMPIREYIYDFFPNPEASLDMPKRMSIERTYNALSLRNRMVIAEPKKVAFLTVSEKINNRIMLQSLRKT